MQIYDDLARLERDLGIVPAENLFEGLHTTRIYNLLVHGELHQRIPVHPAVLPVVERVLDPGLPDLLALLHCHRARRAPSPSTPTTS